MRARVERFSEPALLLLVSAGPTHGYELLEALPELIGDERVDVGNVYRTLRAFEDEGLVASEWKDFWIYVLAPMTGAVVGALLYGVVREPAHRLRGNHAPPGGGGPPAS